MTTNEETNKDWLWSFTKKMVAFVCILFTIAFVVAVGVAIYALAILQDYTMVMTVFSELCSIFRDMIISYCVKAGVENYQKLKKLY